MPNKALSAAYCPHVREAISCMSSEAKRAALSTRGAATAAVVRKHGAKERPYYVALRELKPTGGRYTSCYLMPHHGDLIVRETCTFTENVGHCRATELPEWDQSSGVAEHRH